MEITMWGKKEVGQESGLLSDLEILERLIAEDEKCIFISPLINPIVQVGPSSLDVHLGTEFSSIQVVNNTHIDLTETNKKTLANEVKKNNLKQRIVPDEYFVLHPGEFTLGTTLEFFRFPADIAGRIEGRSSLGRLGLQVHATAGFVDPGFEGTLTYELINAGRLPLKISPGLRLGQICFFKVHDVQVDYMHKKYRKYGGMLGVESSKIFEDPEISKR